MSPCQAACSILADVFGASCKILAWWPHNYNEEPNFATKVKRMLALAFLLIDNVVHHFETLIEDPEYRVLDPLILYFEVNFIGRLRPRNRRLDSRDISSAEPI